MWPEAKKREKEGVVTRSINEEKKSGEESCYNFFCIWVSTVNTLGGVGLMWKKVKCEIDGFLTNCGKCL